MHSRIEVEHSVGTNPLVWNPLVSSICSFWWKSWEEVDSNGTHYSNGSPIARGRDSTHMLDDMDETKAISKDVAEDGRKMSAGTGMRTSTPLDKSVPDIVSWKASVSGVARLGKNISAEPVFRDVEGKAHEAGGRGFVEFDKLMDG